MIAHETGFVPAVAFKLRIEVGSWDHDCPKADGNNDVPRKDHRPHPRTEFPPHVQTYIFRIGWVSEYVSDNK